jgi:hypothetical protein
MIYCRRRERSSIDQGTSLAVWGNAARHGRGSSLKRGRGRAVSPQLCGVLGLALALAGLLAPASASALEHPFLENFGAVNQPTFTEAEGLAVDQSTGDLLVIDAGSREPGEGTLSRWHEDGTPAEFSALGSNVIEDLTFKFPEEVQVAVDNSGGATDGNIYLAQSGATAIDIFDEDGNSLGQLTEYKAGPTAEGAATHFGAVCGVAVDPAGNLYVGEFGGGGNVHKYEPSGNPPVTGDSSANFPFEKVCTVAAGAEETEGFIFPAQLSNLPGPGRVAKLSSASGAEQYTVDLGVPGPTTTVSVDPGSGHVLVALGGEVREYDASGASEALPLPPIATGGGRVNGIAVNETTGNVYIARQGNLKIEVWGPAVLLPEAITEPASVIGETVTLHGVVNADEGPPASCVFEYVEVSAKGFEGATSVPCSPAGPFTGNVGMAVSAEISGLPEAAYRFRLVAENENGKRRAAALLFNTFERVPGLPDGRAYELVSPAQKIGQVFPREPLSAFGSCSECLPGITIQMMPMQSTPNGEALVYEGQPFSAGLASRANEYLARRGPGGWANESLSEPSFETLSSQGYAAFSADLSRGIIYQADPPLVPQAPNQGGLGFANLYLRTGGTLQPLILEEPPNRPPGTPGGAKGVFLVRFAGVNAGSALSGALTHVAFEANDALTGASGVAPAAPEVGAEENCAFLGSSCNLYEWVGGELRLVNVLPNNNNAASGAVIGAGRLLGTDVISPTEYPSVERAISDDGSRIFWSAEESGHVYARIDGEETLEVPGPALCKKSVPRSERVCFQTASVDGSRVLLSGGQLDELSETGDAYEQIADLSEGEGGFEGILGTNEDLSRIYFVDKAALIEETNENGEQAEEGEFNLFLWEEGETTFIGRLNALDNAQGTNVHYGTWKAAAPDRLAQVTPDGRYLVFVSQARLTGYDNAASGGGICVGSGGGFSQNCNEVFEYDALKNTLSCASCNPSGARPLGHSVLTVTKGENGFFPFPQAGNLSKAGEGRLFFESQDVLSPRDTNGNIQDVYEWEPNGVGSCKRAPGCVYLISNGRSENDSMFLDSTPSGDDAFFVTRERLLPVDRNSQLDVYDARAPHIPGEAVGFPEAESHVCGGEACAGPLGSSPAQPSAGSGEFSGAGNPPATHKKKHKKKKHKKKKHKGGGSR